MAEHQTKWSSPQLLGPTNLPDGMPGRQHVRYMLDRFEIGQELTRFKWEATPKSNNRQK